MSEKLRACEMIIENPTSDPECPEARRADFGDYGSHLLDLPQPLPPSDFKSVDRQCGEVTASDADEPTHDFVRTYDERSRSAWKRLRHCAESSSASFGSSNDKKRVRFDHRDGRDTGAISEAA